MKALLLIFSLLLILLLVGLWVGAGSYPQRWELEKRTVAQEASNKDKKEEITKIQADLKDVKSGHAAIEERARSELGMIGKGETFVEVILQPDEKQTKQVKQTDEKLTTNKNKTKEAKEAKEAKEKTTTTNKNNNNKEQSLE